MTTGTYKNHGYAGAVAIYPGDRLGRHGPRRLITGSQTGMEDGPSGIALDRQGNIYVATSGIAEFAADADGNVRPFRQIHGPGTKLSPVALAVDDRDNIYVLNLNGTVWWITVYPPAAGGSVPPTRFITGQNTGLNYSTGIAVDRFGYIYVCNQVGNQGASVSVFAPGKNGNVAPVRTIAGPATRLQSPQSIALDDAGNIYVTNVTNHHGGTVTEYAAGADGNAAPIREIAGPRTTLSYYIGGIAVR